MKLALLKSAMNRTATIFGFFTSLLGRIHDESKKITESMDILEKAMQKIIDRDEEGGRFYKDEEKGKISDF